MDDSWRFRPIQSNFCPVCATSHFPFCPPPPAFAYTAGDAHRRFPPPPDLNPTPFHRPIHDPVRDPNPFLPFQPSNRFLHDECLNGDGFPKRMRVEDPHPFPPPPPPSFLPRMHFDDERRLSLIREHGRQDSALVADRSFNPAPIQKNHHQEADSFDAYQKLQDFPRLQSMDMVLPPERRNFYGGELQNFRNVSSWSRSEENYMDRVADERTFIEFRPPFAHDRQFYQNESSSYTLPKQPQYPHSESYHMMSKIANDEQENHYPPPYPSPRPPLENKFELQNEQKTHFEFRPPVFEETRKASEHYVDSVPYESSAYRMGSAVAGQVHSPQTYPPFEPYANFVPNESNAYRIDNSVPHESDALRMDSAVTGRVHSSQTYPPFEPYVNYVPNESNAYRIDNSMPYESDAYRMDSAAKGRVHSSQTYPPLPPHPPLPPPPEPSPPPHLQDTPLMMTPPPMLSRVPATSSARLFPTPPSNQSSLESRSMVKSNLYNEMADHTSTGFLTEGLPFVHQTPSKEYMEGRGQTFLPRHSPKDEPTVIDACHLFRQPHRASRPDHIVVILRGLPGSGKSYLAKALRDLEVESGGNAPRIHAMDDYFIIEVEKKVEENEGSKSSGSSRGKKRITKKVIEYCYEPEMEEAYRSSMLKAFKKTLDEGNFTFIIVDDRNLRVADFAQFWAIAKRSGYEVYLLEATYKDTTGCAARNVHGFTVEDIQKMAEQWEEAPSLYLQLDIQSLFCGDNLNEQSIQEVDMDTDDTACDEEETHKLQQTEEMKITEPLLNPTLDGGFVKIGERWNADEEEEEELTGVKDLRSSKWSKDVDDDVDNSDGAGGTLSALSGLIQAYGKSDKSVHWGDQVEKGGFSIGSARKQNRSSLVIGPGSGYNLNSNPLREDDDALQSTGKNMNESKRRFTEQLRAERESFKAVFDRRRQRIGGLWDADDE